MTSGVIRRSFIAAVAATLALVAGVARAMPHPRQLNITKSATTWPGVPYFLNNVSFAVCAVIGTLVFCAMFIALFRFRKSRGAVAEQWSHNTRLEVIWTAIPVLILIGLAYLATGGLRS